MTVMPSLEEGELHVALVASDLHMSHDSAVWLRRVEGSMPGREEPAPGGPRVRCKQKLEAQMDEATRTAHHRATFGFCEKQLLQSESSLCWNAGGAGT